MSRYCIIQDQDRCIGCLSCEIYCRENKQLPEGLLEGIFALQQKLTGKRWWPDPREGRDA